MRYRFLLVVAFLPLFAEAATVVPDVVQMPGTQPGEVGTMESYTRCDNCHQDSGYPVNLAGEWRGSMMSHAGRDPLFWATVAIAEQDFDGAGDLCIRCHMPNAWVEGRSTPTDGSSLTHADAAESVSCDTCHKATNPDNSEHTGVMNSPFIANDGGSPATGFYGSAQLSFSSDAAKLGPFADAVPKHQWAASQYHRDVNFCGTCHDVSNPVVGDLAPNNGVQNPLPVGDAGTKYGGSTLSQKAAFNYFPHQYGVVERTYSEHMASMFPVTPVSDYDNNPAFPSALKAGSIKNARDAAVVAGTGGDYADGTTRYFSCQTCHMAASTGYGANKSGVPQRPDLPAHDLTGGNYWMPQVIQYMDDNSTLLLGTGISAEDRGFMDAGALRAKANLESAASLSLTGNTLRITNLTGHKLISGYPEGRRMWLNIVWKDASDAIIREDGAYGSLQVDFDINNDSVVDSNDSVDTLLDLYDSNSKVYEAHGAITQEWASDLIGLGFAGTLPVAYNRTSGVVTHTLADVAAQQAGTYQETFHFVLNNKVVKDNRIPPWGMGYDEGLERSILPVPETQYGNPGAGGTFNHWDDFTLNPPANAASATIKLMYQPTSWEYIQFLYLANNGTISNLSLEGDRSLDAWLNTGMAAPHTMETINWIPDDDADGIINAEDNCPDVANSDQANSDTDLYGDACDVFPNDETEWADFDGDGTGDNADTDDDNDGVSDSQEIYCGTDPFNALDFLCLPSAGNSDFDNDKDDDLMLRSVLDGSFELYQVDNTQVSSSSVLPIPVTWTASSWIHQSNLDVDGDGDMDMLLRNSSNGSWRIIFMQAGNYASNAPIWMDGAIYEFAASGDLDADGDDDVILKNTNLNNYQKNLIQNGSVETKTYIPLFGGDYNVVGMGDFDGDIDDDVLMRRTSTGKYRRFDIESGNVVGSAGLYSVYSNADYNVQMIGDIDADGDDDLILRNTATGVWRAFIMQNNNVSSSNIFSPYANTLWQFQTEADLDGDGDTDLLLRNTDTGVWRSFTIENGQVTGNASFNATTDLDKTTQR